MLGFIINENLKGIRARCNYPKNIIETNYILTVNYNWITLYIYNEYSGNIQGSKGLNFHFFFVT